MSADEGVPVEPSTSSAAGTPQTPALGRGVAQVQQIRVDAMPSSLEVLARLTPEQRSAIYLNQVRNAQQSGIGLGY